MKYEVASGFLEGFIGDNNMSSKGIYDEQMFHLALKAEIERLKRSGTNPSKVDFLEKEAQRLFSRYKLLITPPKDKFPDKFIDISVLYNVNPIQKGFLHYTVSSKYILKNDVILPFATSLHDNSELFISEYLVNNYMDYAKNIVEKKIEEKIKVRDFSSTQDEKIKNELDNQKEKMEYMTLEEQGKFKLKTEGEIRAEVITEAKNKINQLETFLQNPSKNIQTLSELLCHISTGHSFSNSRGQIRCIDLPASHIEGKGYGTIFAISDAYRLCEEHKIQNVLNLLK